MQHTTDRCTRIGRTGTRVVYLVRCNSIWDVPHISSRGGPVQLPHAKQQNLNWNTGIECRLSSESRRVCGIGWFWPVNCRKDSKEQPRNGIARIGVDTVRDQNDHSSDVSVGQHGSVDRIRDDEQYILEFRRIEPSLAVHSGGQARRKGCDGNGHDE